MNLVLRLMLLFLLFPIAGRAQDAGASDPIGKAAELRNRQEFGAAIALLRGYVAEHPGNAYAQFMLGETLYWIGDWSGAKRHFTQALRLDPKQAEARRQLDEIRQVTTPWVLLEASHRRDDQPLRGSAATVEAGVFLTPLQRLIFSASPQRYGSIEQGKILSGVMGWRAYWPSSRIETELAAGYLRRQGEAASDWTGRASVGMRLPKGATLRAKSERAPYLWTLASLATPVMTETVQGIVAWDRNGWLAEAAYGAERFPDRNQLRSAHAWLLAPLLRSHGVTLQAGYGVSYADADESRWDPPSLEGGKGRYTPYYTPDNQRVHNAIFSGTVLLTPALTFRVNSGYGFFAKELAPPSQLGLAPTNRDFHPWNTRISLEIGEIGGIGPARRVSLMISGEHVKTAYWHMNRFSAGLTYRLSPSRSESIP